jgi:hypothetical protein
MEKFILNLQSKNQIIAYREENRLIRYEPGILNEMLDAVETGNTDLLGWFRQFGDCLRSIIMNVYAYRKGLEFGFSEIALDKYGWFKRPQFLMAEDLILGDATRNWDHSIVHVGKGIADVWTYALNYSFGMAGGGSSLSVYGKQFKTREAAVNAGLFELKQMMTEKINHSDTTNFKQAIIVGTLKAISRYEVDRVQLTLF